MNRLELKTQLLCRGINTQDSVIHGRKGGAGPAGACLEVNDMLVNIPFSGNFSLKSPFKLLIQDKSILTYGNCEFPVRFIQKPSFYEKFTSDRIPMKQIALLHGRDCLATTIYQHCILFDKGLPCRFCSINHSLKIGATILKKTPEQLVEVALEAATEGIKHITLTTGTPNLKDHGTLMLAEAVKALKEVVELPIHVQLTPPGKQNLELLYTSGADTIGIHIETFAPSVLEKICPGKRDLDYSKTLKYAVEIFGESQVSSFILGGLGEDQKTTLKGFEEFCTMGVIPFLVPFRPLPGSLMKDFQLPQPDYLIKLYKELADKLKNSGLDITRNRAGCVRCGACSCIDEAIKTLGDD